jgi:catechol 2,3-dioxygenase-like lactoylglutathione lyase family enzyme
MAIAALRGLSHVGLNVADMGRALDFYGRAFGFEPLFDLTFGGPDFESMVGIPGAAGRVAGGRIGDLRLELVSMSFMQPGGPAGFGLAKLSFEVANADDAFEQLGALGIATPLPPHEVEGTRAFSVQDPDGTTIDIIEYLPGGGAWGGKGGRPELRP